MSMGWDLLDWFRGSRPWPQLQRLAERLPQDSHYKAALAQDDDRAELLASLVGDEETAPGSPPLEGYSAVAQRLDRIGDLITMLAEIELNRGRRKGAPPTKLDRAPRPETAADRAKAARRERYFAELESALWPDGPPRG
ncbi:hypothetical protein [Saccharopolyspora sp. 6V]|uniref:hypothetical protein n=1 Tax=Saccharopolyspora sp. 6V TaxID=2877239 RepID=UPI001CD400C3|nr:hypothetical protein [Saccharopolyspora sp. 6V]MCA1191613.1 hypothetical protein [Saccharopolyspora sp. 6V]